METLTLVGTTNPCEIDVHGMVWYLKRRRSRDGMWNVERGGPRATSSQVRGSSGTLLKIVRFQSQIDIPIDKSGLDDSIQPHQPHQPHGKVSIGR